MSDPTRSRRSLWLRIVLVLGGTCLGLAVLAVVLAAIENRRGYRAWAACQRELLAAGEKLDLKEFVPPPVPDEQNFAATPLFAGLDFRPGSGGGHINWPDDYSRAQTEFRSPQRARQRRRPDWDPRLRDLSAWLRAFRKVRTGDPDQPIPVTAPPDATPEVRAALEVLEALKVYDPALNELRQAARRPASRFPVRYSEGNPIDIILPHLAKLKGICLVLQLRAAAEIVAGQGEAALDDLLLLWRVADAVKEEPLLISQMVRQVCFELSPPVLNQGLAARVWTEPQLKQLQARLAEFDFVATAQRALRAERALGIAALAALRRAPWPNTEDQSTSKEPGPVDLLIFHRMILASLPDGWLRFEQANYCRVMQDLLLPDSDIEQRRINPQLVDRKWAELEQRHDGRWKTLLQHRIFANLLLPALEKVHRRFAHAQALADQAMLACALERYHLAQGRYPETLQALVPGYLDRVPADVTSGEPMHYRQTPDGRFILWSVGWNGVDDDGQPAESPHDLHTGDWVWELPPR